MDIPVFHDDQHGTAMVTAAAMLNYSILTGKKIEDLKLCGMGAGAAALSCLKLFQDLGLKKENMRIFDKDGLVYKGRTGNHDYLSVIECEENDRESMAAAMAGCDVFLGLSVGNCIKEEWLMKMNKDPLIMALANPTPEIDPELVKIARPDAIMCTGRSDFPNQVNNVMAFPYIFRGALDVRATKINQEMKIAVSKALAELAREPVDNKVSKNFGKDFTFGKN